MAGPFGGYLDPLDALTSVAGGGLLQRATTQLWLPVDQYLSARADISNYLAQQKAWNANPCILPSPDVLFELDAKGYFPGSLLIDNALRQHGIIVGPWTNQTPGPVIDRKQLWNAVASLKVRVPDPMMIVDAWRRGLITDEQHARERMKRGGGDWDALMEMEPVLRERPGVSAILAAFVRGRIKEPDLSRLMKQAGSSFDLWAPVVEAGYTLPSIRELLELTSRGEIDPNELPKWLDRSGVGDPEVIAFFEELRKRLLSPGELIELERRGVLPPGDFARRIGQLGYAPLEQDAWRELLDALPGVADLNMFGIRHSWQPELVERYGYYLEFPERLREWYGKLGLNYPIGFNVQKTDGVGPAMLSDAYWASHWHVLPLNAAFQAYQRFQPDTVHRFQADNPKLQPFTREDLNIHMRQADFPPGVREWLTALAHPVLGKRDINWGAQFLGWDQAELQSRFRLLGHTTDDSAAMARIAEARATYRDQAWLRSVETRAHQQTVRMIEGLYTDGTIDRAFAMRQLSDAGLSDVLSTQLLDIADFGVERALVRSSVAATSRDFLSGVLSRADAETQLRRIGIQDARVANYIAAWSIQRSARRKRLETAKVAGMVAAGLLSAEEARARLANLQWSDPDATLLLAEAEGRLAKRLASEQKSAQTDARARAKELERLAKDADAQAKKMRAEANRIAPRSAVTAWLRDGIIDDDTFRNMLRERGYDNESIERYLKDAKAPRPRPPRPTPAPAPWPKPAGSAHPAQARLLQWYNDGVIGLQDYADALTDLGYSEGDVGRFVRDAVGGPAPEATAPTNGQAPTPP